MSDRIAVLSEGEVQQVGRPEDIYERPRNRFVADFIGETNFIEGTVTRVADGLAWFAGPAGHPLPAQPCSDVRVGANVALSVRPERLHLVPATTENALPCRIEAQIYLGTDLQYQVSLSDGSRLTVRTPNCVDQSKRFAVGSQAGLLFDQGSASVLHD
ncbi:Spermidine/putrescine import ATP-binding protein PotA [compost metagenome]